MFKKVICCIVAFFMFCFVPKTQDRFFDNSDKAENAIEIPAENKNKKD